MIRALKYAAVLALAVVTVAEMWVRSSTALYTADEIFDLDAVLTFIETGDYTTSHFGGFPFDPVLSSGLAGTWNRGLSFYGGASLLGARFWGEALLLAVGILIAHRLLSRRSLADAALAALGVWLALLLVPDHAQGRVFKPADLWGALYLAAGLVVLRWAPRCSPVLWGVATWLCRVVYLPFGLLFLAVYVADGDPKRAVPARAARAVLLFAAPLIVWLFLIWLRYDSATVAGWLATFVSFVFSHSSGRSLGLTAAYDGWRFSPSWASESFLGSGTEVLLPTLGALCAGPLLVGWLTLRRESENDQLPATERHLLWAAVAGIAFHVFWFFAVAPQQLGRYLLPAIYVSVGAATYCLARWWSEDARASALARSVAGVALTLLVGTAALSAATFVRQNHWKLSYARACRGAGVLAPPCTLSAANEEVAAVGAEICAGEFSEDCLRSRRTELVEAARRMSQNEESAYAAGQLVLLLQAFAYEDEEQFRRDVGPVFDGAGATFRRFVRAAGWRRSDRS